MKTDGRWLLAAYHISMNVLDNPLLNAVKQGIYPVAAAALLAGIALGFIAGKRRAAARA